MSKPRPSPLQRTPTSRRRTSAFSRLLSIGKLGFDVAKHEMGYHIQKNIQNRGQTLEKVSTQIRQMQRVTATLGHMKGAIMKIGQMISLYDIPGLPEEVREILAQLQSQATPIPFEEMKHQVLRDFPHFFDHVTLTNQKPIASASIGQVYKGQTKQGEPVAIKIQIPDIEKIMRSDLKNLGVLAKLFSPWITQKEMNSILQEVKNHLLDECNYIQERKNLEWFARTYSNHPVFHFPLSYPQLSSRHVLTMSFMPGKDIHGFLKTIPSQKKRDDVVYHLAHFYFDQVFHRGVLHADPQFGNYLFTADRIALLDFGCVKHLSPHFVHNLIVFLNACVSFNLSKMQEGYLSLGLTTPRDHEKLGQLLTEFICISQETYRKERHQYGDYTILYKVLRTLPRLLHQKRLHLPPDFVLLERTVAGLYFLTEKCKVHLTLRELVRKYILEHPKANATYITS